MFLKIPNVVLSSNVVAHISSQEGMLLPLDFLSEHGAVVLVRPGGGVLFADSEKALGPTTNPFEIFGVCWRGGREMIRRWQPVDEIS